MTLTGNFRQFCTVVILTIAATVSAQSEMEIKFFRDHGIQPLIKGSQEGNFPAGTYLIPHDIMVDKGKTMTIFPGSTVLFTQNAMLVVNGTLICSGSAEAPVVFKKLDNQDYLEPLDPRMETRWDGIYLPDSARLEMTNTIVSDSKYGIVISGKHVSMSFDSVRFVNNKFQNVKIGERMMSITPGEPIVFHYPEQEGIFIPPAAVQNATETIQQKKKEERVTAYPHLRIGMGIAAGVGLAAGIGGFYLRNKYDDTYQKSGKKSEESKVQTGTLAAAAGACLFGIGAIGFTWTFFY